MNETRAEHFVTIFDFAFAPQGLALYQSLESQVRDFTLWVAPADRAVELLLLELELANLRLLDLASIESEDLLSAKKLRSRREYCWTLTPFLFDAVFDSDMSAARVTYVDADVWVRSSPEPIFREFEESGAGMQITEHAFSPQGDVSKLYGKYCVQFQTAQRTLASPILERWKSQCVEWCFARPEDGKFGDQKYLEEWPNLYPELVNVSKNKHFFLGPWNAERFPYSDGIIYHFHQVRINPTVGQWSIGNYKLPKPHVDELYVPYIEQLEYAQKIMRSKGFEPSQQFVLPNKREKLIAFIAPLTDKAYIQWKNRLEKN